MSATYCVGFIHVGRVTVSQVVLFLIFKQKPATQLWHDAFEELIPWPTGAYTLNTRTINADVHSLGLQHRWNKTGEDVKSLCANTINLVWTYNPFKTGFQNVTYLL